MTEVTELALNEIYAELEEMLGAEVVERASRPDEPTDELARRMPISGNRWVDVAAVKKFIAIIRDVNRGKYLSFDAHTTPSQARVLAVYDNDVGLPHFLLKLYDLSNAVARGEAVSKRRLMGELNAMKDFLTQFTYSQPMASWACAGVECSLSDDTPGLVEVVEVFSGLRMTDFAARVGEGKVSFEHFLAACSATGASLGQLHSVSSRRTVGGPEETALDQYWNDAHVSYVLNAAAREQGRNRFDVKGLWERIKSARKEAGEQPVFSLIHGDPSMEHIVLPNRFFEMHSAIHIAGWRYGGAYIGFEPRPGGMVRRRFLGAPELDFYIFREDLEQHLLGLSFYDDEIEEALASFDRAYCRSFHMTMDECWKDRHVSYDARQPVVTCGFQSHSFEVYCRLLAKLQLTEDYPERANLYFPEFLLA